MIEFMVLSAPRSASTWVANWLTTERTMCLHDPILEHRPEALDAIECDRMLGLSCTGLALLPDFVNAHPARKVIVHRDREAIDLSLISIGLTRLGAHWKRALDAIHGVHVYYEDLFDSGVAARLYTHLTGLPFDRHRHALLRGMHVEPQFDRVAIIPDRAREFRKRLEASLHTPLGAKAS